MIEAIDALQESLARDQPWEYLTVAQGQQILALVRAVALANRGLSACLTDLEEFVGAPRP